MENIILDKTLEIAEVSYEEAYKYLKDKIGFVDNPSSQFYNFLYCLSAAIGLKEEALRWLSEGIYDKGYWYRPEVFEDDDLDSIRGDKEFERCKKESEKRYLVECDKAELICTWREKEKENIMLILHGNQQNIKICKESWHNINIYNYQKEYLQSKALDSYGLYRWDDDAKVQLPNILTSISWESYEKRVLCGFSAGCNEILKSLLVDSKICEGIIFQSPWIPIINKYVDDIIDIIVRENIWIKIICGEQDEDCSELATLFEEKAKEKDINSEVIWVKELRHNYPEDFNNIIENIF